MTVESIRIDRFGRLAEKEYTFAPGLNVIEGDNESGKSTLAAFIRYMLYGFPRATGSEVGEKRKRINWQTGRAAGSMVIAVGGQRYRIERATTVTTGAREKESYRDTVAVFDLQTNTPIKCSGSPGEHFLGVPEAIFLQTAFIGQVASYRPEGSKLSAAIENLLFSGDEHADLPRALARLEELRRTLHYKRGTGGALQELEEQCRSLEGRLLEAQKQNAALLATEGEREAVRKKRLAQEAAAAAARETEALARHAGTVRSYARLHEAEEKLATAEAALIEINGLPAKNLSERDLTDLALSRQARQNAATRLAAADAAYEAEKARALPQETTALLRRAEDEGGIEAIAAYAGQLAARRRLWLVAACLGGALGLLCLVLAFLLPGANATWLLIPALLLGGAGGFCARFAYTTGRDLLALYRSYGVETREALQEKWQELRTAAAQEESLAAARLAAAEAQEAAAREMRRTTGELDTVVRRFHLRLPEGESEAFLDDLAGRIRTVLQEKKQREQERAAAAATVATLRAELRGVNEAEALSALPGGCLPEGDLPPVADCHKKAEQAALQCRLLQEEERQLENRLLSARSRSEDPALLESALAALREKLEGENARYAAVLLACEALTGAGENMRAAVSPRLCAYARRFLASATNGRYEEVGVGSDLGMTVGTDGGTRTPEWLSSGTQDLVYLSLRLALVDLLYREGPPLCFDESFAHLDEGRLAHTVGALANVAEAGQQCLLFTCHRREWETVRQVAPTAGLLRLEEA